MKYLSLISISFSILAIACSQQQPTEGEGSKTLKTIPTDTIPKTKKIPSDSIISYFDKYKCEILRVENQETYRTTISIRIPEQLTRDQMKQIAEELKRKNQKYRIIRIVFLLPNMRLDAGAWAIVNYGSSYNVEINGISKILEDSLKAVTIPNAKIIGKWYDPTIPMESSILIYSINGKSRIHRTYRDWGVTDTTVKIIKNGDEFIVEYPNNFDDYLKIEADGNLGFYDELGLIKKSIRLKNN